MNAAIPQSLNASRMSLKQQLLFLLGMVLLIILLTIAVSVFYFVYQTEQTAWEGRQSEASRSAGTTVSTFVQRVIDTMTVFSVLDAGYIESNPQVSNNVLQQNDALLEMIRLDKTGHVFASANRGNATLANLFTIPQSNWFVSASGGKRYITDVQVNSSDELYLIIAIPAPDGGVVATRLNMNVLWDVVNSIRFGATGRAYLINDQGSILAHTDPQLVLKKTSLQNRPELNNILQAPEYRWRGYYVNLQGQGMVSATAPVTGTNWIVVTELSQDEAFSVSRNALLLLLGATILFGLIMRAVMSQLLSRLIFNPVQKLRAGAETVGQGDLSRTIEISRYDEIGQVTQAFNDMTTRLRDREEQLASELIQREHLIQELKDANIRATAASNLKSEFLSTMSHELRTPLNAIMGFSGILVEGMAGDLEPTVQNMVRNIYRSSEHLLSLINDILDLSKIEAGRLDLVIAPIKVQDMIDSWRNHVSVLAENKGLRFEVNASGLPQVLSGDKGRISQVVINLLSNAIKFTDTGKVELGVEWANTGLIIKVTDTGVGIPPEAINYIFEEFRQVDGTAQRRHEGTGLGLAIVRKLCWLMGGDVQVASKLGEGSIFTVRLPLQPLAEPMSMN